jgi:hypothetical protein
MMDFAVPPASKAAAQLGAREIEKVLKGRETKQL